MKAENKTIIFNFNDPEDCKIWKNIDDVVMGGISKSEISFTKKGTALFKGKVSLENYGGFASIRSASRNYDLSQYSGIEVEVKGDGKKYKLNLKTDSDFDSILYQAVFKTGKNTWETISIPFNKFLPTFRGTTISDASVLNTGKIKSFGFLISDKQEGPFELEIECIKAFK